MMSSSDGALNAGASSPSVADLLARLDLATEVLEGLDELGVDNRAELLELMDQLERQITDED
jgi:hypothetical protein